jgi:hypothetical protein
MAEAGWYQDPYDASLLRWWDGAAWTAHIQSAATAAQSVTVAAQAMPIEQPPVQQVAQQPQAYQQVAQQPQAYQQVAQQPQAYQQVAPSPTQDAAAAYARAVGYEPPVVEPPKPSRGGMYLAMAVGILGILVGIAAIMYYTIPAHSLPSLLGPVPSAKPHVHRIQRGQAAAVAAVALLIIAVVIALVGRRSERRQLGA